MYLHDLPKNIYLKFADDVVAVSVGFCRSDIEKELQQAVNDLTTWSKKWAMNVNVSKTKAMVFGDCVSSVKLLINDIPLSRSLATNISEWSLIHNLIFHYKRTVLLVKQNAQLEKFLDCSGVVLVSQ